MIKITDKADCSGCGACAQACPNNCLLMKPDNKGFSYPDIDTQACTECGICESVCYAFQPRESAVNYSIFAAKSKDDEIRYQSSSGGIFTLLAEAILEQGGVVFGAGFDKNYVVSHSAAYTTNELQKFRKSKYVQSETGHTFTEAKKHLEAGRKVLFSGTPCQIAGLNAFLGKTYDGLICVDLICTGVNSPKVWERYLGDIENEYHSDINSVVFREKEYKIGVLTPEKRNLTLKVGFADGKQLYEYASLEPGQNIFFHGFLSRLYLRPSCHSCRARSFTSGSDIQLADFWGVEQVYPEFCDKSDDGTAIPFGVSAVLTISEKGKKLFESIKDKTTFFCVDKDRLLSEGAFGNWHLLFSDLPKHPNSEAFFNALVNEPDIPVSSLIRSHLLQTYSQNTGYLIGLFGSLAARQVFESAAGRAHLNLGFQFTGSNIVSMMSPPVNFPECCKFPKNAIRAQLLKDDFTKEFMKSFACYAKEVQYFCFDLLEERLIPVAVQDSYVTKSDAFFEASGLSGIPLDQKYELWKEHCLLFVDLIKAHFNPDRVFMFELYLAEKFNITDDTHLHPSIVQISKTNAVLYEKYTFIKKHLDGIHIIKLPHKLWFTEKYNDYGCLPEHFNSLAYQYIAEAVCKLIENRQEPLPPIKMRPKSNARKWTLSQSYIKAEDLDIRRDAYVFSHKYKTLLDWMYKKTLSRPIWEYLKQLGYLSIAIYGLGEIGQLFLWEIEQTSITVVYAIDQDAHLLYTKIPVIMPEDEYPVTDAIVVCIPSAPDELISMLHNKVKVPVLTIDQLIYMA